MDEEREGIDKVDKYVDYRELYFKMMRAAEKAINALIVAQQACEEAYVDATDRWDRENGVDDISIPGLSELIWEGREEEKELEDQLLGIYEGLDED